MKKLVVLTGAGISAESGLQTFRDADGLWEGYNVYDVATPEAWERNPAMVQEFYNQRRKAVQQAQPNAAHTELARLQQHYEVHIITQNIDDLHERAGSENVLHLHGIITWARSSVDDYLFCHIGYRDLQMGELCELGSQLRPHVVWFGESVPMIEPAAGLCRQADVFAVIGTSLAVYPAAGLVNYVPGETPKYLIDPKLDMVYGVHNLTVFQEKATIGIRHLVNALVEG